MEKVIVRPGTEADAEAIARIHYDALALYHDFYAGFLAVHPKVTLPKSTTLALANPKASFLVALAEGSDRILGFVRYQVETPTPIPTPEASDNVQNKSPAPSLFAPKDHLKEVWGRLQDTGAPLEERYEELSKGQKHAYVYHLMIDPGHQRRGIGKQLLEAMMSKVEQDSLPAFIVSSRESHRLYLQLGFVDVAHRSIDNEAWAKELCRVERQAGIAQHANLPAQYQGITEDEHLMVRWPKGENTCK